MGTPCHASSSAPTIASGSSTHRIDRTRSTQKLPSVLRAIARQAANKSDSDRQAGRARQKILHREANHLAEVAQCGFAAIGLPGGRGGETDGRVHRQVRRHRRGHVGGIEPGKESLQSQDGVKKQRANHSEDDECSGILLPGISGFGFTPVSR